jgi:hypothetical protein
MATLGTRAVANTHPGEGDHFGLAAAAVGTSARVQNGIYGLIEPFAMSLQQGLCSKTYADEVFTFTRK